VGERRGIYAPSWDLVDLTDLETLRGARVESQMDVSIVLLRLLGVEDGDGRFF
jgi:hypothetical protein